MPRTARSWFSRFASAVAISTLSVLAACGETDAAPVAGTNGSCTIALAASTDDAHLQAAIETALRRGDVCSLPDAPLRADARATGSDVRTSYQLVRVERDEESVRAVFQAVPETRPANGE
jgi:hypothetical protein